MALHAIKRAHDQELERKTLDPRQYALKRFSRKELVVTRIRWDQHVIDGVRSTIHRNDCLTYPANVENFRRLGAMKWRLLKMGLKLHVVTDPVKNLIHVWCEED